MKNTVYIVKCPDYSKAEETLEELITMMGGMSAFVAPDEKIAFKVNLLRPAKPEEAVSTHPAVVTALGKMVRKQGAGALIAESPGAGYQYNKKILETVYRTCEMTNAAEDAGIDLNLDTTYRTVSYPNGSLIKRFEVITPVLKADGVFNLCKLKTHLFMHMTGAVKNNFGVIPGLTKPGYHAKLHDTGLFANMLLDLAEYVSPRLSIMDAVVGMEGEGPGAGEPRQVGLLLASESPLALDVVASEIIGLKRQSNPVLIEAEKRDIHPNRLDEVDIVGPDIAELRIPDYKFPATMFEGMGLGPLPWWQRAMQPFFKDGMSAKPHIVKDKCIACGACHDACPMHVITIVDEKYARIDDENCIRCYCCHEMCPNDAVEIRQGLLYRILNR